MNAIDPSDHQLFSRIIDFSQKLSSRTDKGHAASEEVIASEFPELMNGKSLQDFVKMNMESVKADSLSSLPMRIEVAKAALATEVASGSEALSLILDSKLNVEGVTIESCRNALAFVESLGKDGSESKERMMQLIMAKFPFAKDC